MFEILGEFFELRSKRQVAENMYRNHQCTGKATYDDTMCYGPYIFSYALTH